MDELQKEKLLKKINELEGRIEILEERNEIFIKHIAFLQSRTRSFFDRFKFGRFKPLDIEKELGKTKRPKVTFTLNDD